MNNKAILCGFAVFCVAILTATCFLCLNDSNTQTNNVSNDLNDAIQDGTASSDGDGNLIGASATPIGWRGDLAYDVYEDRGYAVVTAYSGASDVYVPDTIEYKGEEYPVTMIGKDAIRCENGPRTVSIGSNIESIGDNAFWATKMFYDGRLEEFKIRDIEHSKLTVIGDSAFREQKNLTSIELPASVQVIKNSAFRDSGLQTCVLHSKTLEIWDSAFRGDKSLTDIDLGNVTLIKNSAFRECESLKTVTLNSTSLEIRESAFRNCHSLDTIDLKKVTKLGDGAFHECTNLTYADLTSIQSIAKTSFRNCPLEKVIIGNDLTSIRSDSFYTTEFYSDSDTEIDVSVDSLRNHTFERIDGKLVMVS